MQGFWNSARHALSCAVKAEICLVECPLDHKLPVHSDPAFIDVQLVHPANVDFSFFSFPFLFIPFIPSFLSLFFQQLVSMCKLPGLLSQTPHAELSSPSLNADQDSDKPKPGSDAARA